MRYQVRYETNLSIIHDEIPTWETIAKHFAQNGYDPLYVYECGLLDCIITFEDFLSHQIINGIERDFIRTYKKSLSSEDIKDAFLENLDTERLVYVENGKVVCEVNALIQLPLQNSISKNLMALRYVDIFYDELKFYLEQFAYVVVLSEIEVADFFKEKYPQIDFCHVYELEDAYYYLKHDKNVIFFDFLYNKKIRECILPQLTNAVDLCKVLTKFALDKMIFLSKERDIALYFYKLPRFFDLSCLHELEYDNYQKRKSIGTLIGNERYVDAFTRTENEKFYLKKKLFHSSQRLDNGYCFVMDDSFQDMQQVHNGIRLNGGIVDVDANYYNFYGPCTAYGFLVEDNLTVTSIIQQHAVAEGIHMQPQNRAGIHGDNELNSIMEALKVPVASGDAHIFLDVLEDLPIDVYPNFSFVKNWFNESKPKEEIQFLDFPGHCNSDANRIMAQYIFDDVKLNCTTYREVDAVRTPLLEDVFNPLDLLQFTHSSYIKQRRIIHSLFIEARNRGKIGAVVIVDNYDTDTMLSMVKQCSVECDYLFVFCLNDCVSEIETNRKLNKKIVQLNPKCIMLIPLEHFFNVSRYFYDNCCFEESYENAVFCERAFLKLIQEELYVNIYFYVNPFGTEDLDNIVNEARAIFDGRIIKMKL